MTVKKVSRHYSRPLGDRITLILIKVLIVLNGLTSEPPQDLKHEEGLLEAPSSSKIQGFSNI